MARTPFKLKSGNSMAGSSFKMMGSSPAKHFTGHGEGEVHDHPHPPEEKSINWQDDKSLTYNAAIDAVKGDMTDKELREMAVSQHRGKQHKWNVSFNDLKNARIAAQKLPVEIGKTPSVKEKAYTPPPVEEEAAKKPGGWKIGFGDSGISIGSGEKFFNSLSPEKQKEYLARKSKTFKGDF